MVFEEDMKRRIKREWTMWREVRSNVVRDKWISIRLKGRLYKTVGQNRNAVWNVGRWKIELKTSVPETSMSRRPNGM